MTEGRRDPERVPESPTDRWTPPPPPTARRGAWPWALAAALVAFTIGVGGCIAVSAIVANRVADEVKERRERHAITRSQYDTIELGMTRGEVIARLGKEPQGASDLVVESVFGDDPVGPDCITYLEEGDLLFPAFRFCFDEDGVVTSKASG
jgi:hypothetical protein